MPGEMPQDYLGGNVHGQVMGVPQALWFAFAALHFYFLIAATKDLVSELGIWCTLCPSAVPGLSLAPQCSCSRMANTHLSSHIY